MTTVDQRILIPAPQTVVWAYISEITNNPAWQEEYEGVSFLTAKREGPGTRWRYTSSRGREYVVEITAWYNGLGYEYVFIDGPGYKENRGRIRLQEIPEGTIVQWTFSFEISGMLAGLRNHRRQVEISMASGLKALYRKIKQFAADGVSDPKSLMRDAPDVHARSEYKPRHPSVAKTEEADEQVFRPAQTPVVFDEPPVELDDGQAIPTFALEEPPVEVEDTRPRPAVTLERPVVADESADESQEAVTEPDFLTDYRQFEPPREVQDTPPRGIRAESLTTAAPLAEPETPLEEVLPSYQREETAPAEAETMPGEEPGMPEAPVEVTELEAEAQPPAAAQASAAEAEPVVSPVSAEPGASIWDVFGVPRPSERHEEGAVSAAVELEQPPTPAPRGTIAGQGLRIRLRRALVQIRRPF